MTPLDDIALHHLGGGIRASLKHVAARCQAGGVDDPARAWVDCLGSRLHNMPLSWPPMSQRNQPVLPFSKPHRMTTEAFVSGGGGMAGGATVDVLLQIWFETESMATAFGIPLLLRCVPASGPIPPGVWAELRDAARQLNQVTGSGRVLLIGNPDPFEWKHSTEHASDIYAISTIMLAGMTDPPRGGSGRHLGQFDYDLVSGWIGDPTLAGTDREGNMPYFLSLFDVAHILRIRIRKDDV